METMSPVARLVQITDSHLFTNPNAQMRSRNTRATFIKTLDHARPFIRMADAILLTGDIAQDELGSTYTVVRELMTPLRTPVWCLPGNHDNPVEMSHRLDNDPFCYLHAHHLDNWEIILLNSHMAGAAGGTLGVDELQRLQTHCDTSSASHLLVAIHHHPVPMQSAWLDAVDLSDRKSFQRIVHDSDKVRGVCFGHVHQVSDREHSGVRYMSCPSTCSQFTPRCPDFDVDDKPPGFRWLELYQDGTIRSDVVWLNG